MNRNPMLSFLKGKNGKKKVQEKKQDEKRKFRTMEGVPMIALVIGNIIVLSLDYRVFEAVYILTHNVVLSAFALFSSGAMFIVWFDILFNYLLSNKFQKYMSVFFSGLSLVVAGVFAFMDYGLNSALDQSKLIANSDFIFATLVIVTILNGIGLFVWYMNDKQISLNRVLAENEADFHFDARQLESASVLFDHVGSYLSKQKMLEDKYGADSVRQMLQILANMEVDFGVDMDGDGGIGTIGGNKPNNNGNNNNGNNGNNNNNNGSGNNNNKPGLNGGGNGSNGNNGNNNGGGNTRPVTPTLSGKPEEIKIIDAKNGGSEHKENFLKG